MRTRVRQFGAAPHRTRRPPLLAGALLAATLAGLAGCRHATPRESYPGAMVLYGTTARIRGFDPVKAGDVASANAIGKIYEGLLEYAYLARPYRVKPLLAEALPQISEDGLTYTFTLRSGLYFQDDPCFTGTKGKGRELVAEDFVYSIKRVADMKTESTGWWVFNDRIVGLDEFRKESGGDGPTDYDAPVDGLRAPDRRTLRIRLKRPYPQLLWILTMHYAFAVPREAVEHYGHEFLNHPVGTGPYRLARWRRNYRVEFERSPKWAQTGRVELYPSEGEPGDAEAGLLDDAGKPVPFIDRVVQFVVSDSSTEWLKFVTGGLESSGISRDNWDAVVTENRGLTDSLRRMKIRLFSAPTLDIFYIGFNMDDPVVGPNKKLRQALTCAFDSGRWVRFLNNRVIRAVGPIPPGVAGYEDKASPYPFNLEQARRLLAEAGYPNGIEAKSGKRLQLTVELGSGQEPEVRQSMDLLADFLARIGVTLNPSYNNWPTFLSKVERRQCQLYRLGWIADYPDAENFLQLFYGPNESPGTNHSNYKDPEFDSLYEQVRVMPDSPERTALYRRMADILIEDCPWIYMYHRMAYGLHHHWIRNYKPHDFPYGMTRFHRIDTAARRDWQATYGRTHWRK
ncbi:MAG: ABC transporter substrate-binding protein [Kiritimatiellae bacterium]|nr:ABC transporter substrate-binding protein [Kiritimatiellia bacterium]